MEEVICCNWFTEVLGNKIYHWMQSDFCVVEISLQNMCQQNIFFILCERGFAFWVFQKWMKQWLKRTSISRIFHFSSIYQQLEQSIDNFLKVADRSYFLLQNLRKLKKKEINLFNNGVEILTVQSTCFLYHQAEQHQTLQIQVKKLLLWNINKFFNVVAFKINKSGCCGNTFIIYK